MKNKTLQSSFHRPYIKFLSAIFTAITIPIFLGVFKYFSAGEGRTDEFFSNFGYEFTITLIINLTFLFIIIFPLSILIDGLIIMKVKNKKTFIFPSYVISYVLIGIISGSIYSYFISSFNPISSILYGLELTFLFVIYQFTFNWLINKIKIILSKKAQS